MSKIDKKFELSPRLKLGVGRSYSQNQILKISTIVCVVLAALLTINALRLLAFDHGQKPANPDLGAPAVLGASVTRAVPTPEVQFVQYKVVPGDTLFNISQKFNIDWTTLATLNDLKSPFKVVPGQVLNIPKQD